MSNKLEKIPIKLLVTFVFILLSAIVFLVQINKKPTKIIEASWWSPSWSYRKAIPITYSGTALSDFQVSFDIGTSALINDAKMKSDCADIRVTDASGNLLYHWIEENNPGCNSPLGDTKVWTKVNSIPDGGTTIYVYYGNSSATDTQDGNNVFEFFDDFSSFDSDTWTATGSQSITNGKMTITTGAVYSNSTLGNNPQNQIFEAKANYVNGSASYSGICIANSQSTSSGNSTSKALAYNITDSTTAYYLRAWGASGSSAGYNIVSNGTLSTPTLGVEYIIGFEFQGTSKINYFHKNLDYSNLSTNNPNGTWNYPYYLWLGFYNGSSASTSDIDDIQVDWLRIRQYSSTVPSTSPQTEQEKPDSAQIGGVGSTDITPISKKLIAHYKFDEGYGSTAHDTVGANHGTFGTGSSAPTWTQNGKVGKALSFDGNDYLSISDFDINSNQLSLSGWVYFTNKNASLYNNLVVKASEYVFYLPGSNNNFAFYIYGQTDCLTTDSYTQLTNNTWYHFTGVYNGSTKKIYLNGKEITSQDCSAGTLDDTSNPIYIGSAQFGNTYYTNGLIDEVKIYNYALTEDEVKQDYNQGMSAVIGKSSSDTGSTAPAGSSSQEYCIPGDTSTCSPPIAEWTFDKKDATYAFDVSGNSNHGTLGTGSSAPTYTPGKIGNALSFTNGDYADTNYIPPTGPKTVSYWVKYHDLSATSLIGLYDVNKRFYVGVSSTNYYYGVGTTYVRNVPHNLSANVWYYTTLTFDGSTAIYYVNGKQVSSIPTTQSSQAQYSFYLGRYNNIGTPAGDFDGLIDNLKIYDYARTPAQVAWDYNRGAPIAHYKMDETEGSIVHDTSENQLHGTLGSGSSSPTWVSGKISNALSFDGNDKVSIGSTLFANSSFSISLWFNPSSLPAENSYIFSEGYSYTNTNYISLTSSGNLDFRIFSSQIATNNNPISPNNWYHLVTTYNGTTGYLYLNGNLIKQNGASKRGSPDRCTIGIGTDNSNPFSGSTDDIRIFNYALTQDQVKQIYNNGAVSFN